MRGNEKEEQGAWGFGRKQAEGWKAWGRKVGVGRLGGSVG